jgi:excinuclease ABC subunit C
MAWTPEQVKRLTGDVPRAPGVYLMRDGAGKVVYIGKAVDLQARVSQYFHKAGDPRPFVALLSGILERIDTVVTTTEKEALILENELIKKHRPPFNVLLKDDKTYLYLRIDPGEDFPRLELVRRRRSDGAHYFGPYASATSVRGTHALVNRHFGLRTCSDQQFRTRTRPCIECQMQRCLGPCVGSVPAQEYRGRVDAVVLFLRGRYDEVRRRLAERMAAASEAENFEEAARLRDQVRAIQTALTRQAVVLPTVQDADMVGVARSGESVAFAILRFEGGVLTERVPVIIDGVVAPLEEIADSVLLQYYGRAPVPEAVMVPAEGFEGLAALGEVLATRSGHPVKVKTAVKGPLGDAVRMASRNAEQLLVEHLARSEVRDRASGRLAELLRMERPPRRIEGFDLSTFQAGEPVGSMVVFVDGRAEKRAWRTFAVRLEEGPGDVGFLREVLKRRFTRALDEGQELPDLVMLDGGEAQLRAAMDVMAGLGVDVPLVGLAKSRVVGKGHGPATHSPERLYVPTRPDGAPFEGGGEGEGEAEGVREPTGGEARRIGAAGDVELIVPQQNDPGLHLLMRVRDEAHRFAVTFHRKRRGKKERGSVLDDIPGLGKTRRTALLRHFGSVAALRAADLPTLKAVPGLPGNVAEKIFDKIHG